MKAKTGKSVVQKGFLGKSHWLKLRRQCWRRSGGRCENCGRGLVAGETHLHHLTYARRGHELPEDVRLICLECHGRAHPHHTFRPMKEQMRRRRLRAEGRPVPRSRHRKKRPVAMGGGSGVPGWWAALPTAPEALVVKQRATLEARYVAAATNPPPPLRPVVRRRVVA